MSNIKKQQGSARSSEFSVLRPTAIDSVEHDISDGADIIAKMAQRNPALTQRLIEFFDVEGSLEMDDLKTRMGAVALIVSALDTQAEVSSLNAIPVLSPDFYFPSDANTSTSNASVSYSFIPE